MYSYVYLTCPPCRYVEEVLTVQEETDASLKSQFVAQQLCSMLTVLDPTDEVGRSATTTVRVCVCVVCVVCVWCVCVCVCVCV